jgi:hypothetical protein
VQGDLLQFLGSLGWVLCSIRFASFFMSGKFALVSMNRHGYVGLGEIETIHYKISEGHIGLRAIASKLQID